ncbi:SMP-30/gluconolactonase/LRE family protein [Nocardia terpenica]|nr:SMP-30/gluconolactonase/LRE family protein [Nocardia terpenica]
MLLSEQAATGSGGGIQRLEHSGARSTVVSGVDGAGKIMVSGDVAYYTTGLSLQAKLSGQTGSIQAIDLDSGQVSTVAAGLQMPNGLAQLPDGDFVVSSDLGIDTRVIRVHDGASVGPFSSKATSTNGIAYDPARRRLYVATTFTPATTIAIFDIDKPDNPSLIELPGPGPLNAADGLTIGPDGDVYLAYSIGGKVLRVDPDNGGWCTIAENLPLTTGVHFGDGAGWDSDSLYAVSYLGTVTRLSPTR